MQNSSKHEKCRWCGTPVKDYKDSIMVPAEDGYICLCLHCYNKEISKAAGIDYEDIKLHPVVINDADDVGHEFHFSLRLMGEQQVLSAFEINGVHSQTGYEFSIIGDTADGVFPLFSKLYARMLKALGRKHIFKNQETDSWQITNEDIVRGQISCTRGSTSLNRIPMMVVDGKEIHWEDFGQMLMAYEGFNFKFEIFDQSDEID